MQQVNPLTTLCVCAAWIVAALIILDARFLIFTIVLFAAALLILRRTSPLTLLLLMIPFALFGFGFVTTNLLFRQETDFATMVSEEAAVSSEALSAGLTLALRAIACGMVSVFFALTTDPGAFLRALMAHARLPARFGYPLVGAMQLVPQILREAQQIRMARAMHRGGKVRRLPSPAEAVSLVVPLMAFAIRRAGRMAIAMEARGFVAAQQRTIINVPSFSHHDAIAAAAGLASLVLAITVL